MSVLPGTMIEVSVVYALPERAVVRVLHLAPGTTALEAARRSGIIEEFPELRGLAAGYGVFGVRATSTQVLADGDRLELYRPLAIDPMEARRRRAAARGRRPDSAA